MEFNPEDAGHILIDDGEYDFDVSAAEACVSKFDEGEEQIQISLRIYCEKGATFLNQWLSPKKTWKIKQFALCTGMEDKFKAGKLLAEDCLGKAGRVKIGRYEKVGVWRNCVFAYLESDQPVKDRLAEFRAATKSAEKDPDIPF